MGELNVVEFYLGGVPESVEPEILSQLNLHKGFTGCILMNYAVTNQLSGQYQVRHLTFVSLLVQLHRLLAY